MNTTTEQDIIPSNPNIGRSRRRKLVKTIDILKTNIKKEQETQKVVAYSYSEDIDPFRDTLHFMRYYRAFLSLCVNGQIINFDSYNVDSVYAAKILDLLQENKRTNKVFLNSWLRYFCDYKLKGEKALKIKYTSMKILLETFEEYNVRHIDI